MTAICSPDPGSKKGVSRRDFVKQRLEGEHDGEHDDKIRKCFIKYYVQRRKDLRLGNSESDN